VSDALEAQARRLEQQSAAFEKLHADELKRFEEQLAAYKRLQSDELRMLREQLSGLQDELRLVKAEQAQPSVEPAPLELKVTRRDLLTGNLPPFSRK
jgi:hypothetical protein